MNMQKIRNKFQVPKAKTSIRTISTPPELIEKFRKQKIKHNKYRLANILECEDLVYLNTNLTPFISTVLRFIWNRFESENIYNIIFK